MAGFTFCFVMASNATTALFSKNRKTITQNPEFSTFSLVLKGAYFGVLWPAFYFGAVTNPSSVFCLWNSLDYKN